MSVLIVGAGPVGLAAACELARHGAPVRIIDKLAEPTWQSRAVLVHARTLEGFARLGVADPIVAAGRRTVAMQMHADGAPVGRFELDTVESPYPFSVTLAQTDTERILSERLAELGVAVERGRELTGFEQDSGGVRARLAGGETLECDWLLGADGAHSTVRHAMGLRLEGSFEGERFLLGDVEAEHDLEAAAMHSFFSRDTAPLLVFPMLGRRLRLIAQIDGDGEESLAALQRIADERAGGIRLESAHWITIFEIHHAQVPRYRDGRVFLAGDAAHVHSPAGGQGMNTGIQDAFNLAWKLAEAEPSEALLDSYAAERMPVAAHVIKVTTEATNVGTVHSALLRGLRDRAMRVAMGLAPIAHALADETEETRIAYHGSPIVAGRRHGHGPRPGDIAPLVPDLRPGHAVLAVGAQAFDGAVAVEDPGDRYGFGRDGGLVVVRPDGYIGLIAGPGDRAAVDAYFAALAA